MLIFQLKLPSDPHAFLQQSRIVQNLPNIDHSSIFKFQSLSAEVDHHSLTQSKTMHRISLIFL